MTETQGTNIYLFTNPTIIGSDPAPLAFTNLFSSSNSLTTAALAGSQSMFSITYMDANYITSFNARAMTSATQTDILTGFYDSPSYNSATKDLTVSNVQILGGVGTIYFVLVYYKTIIFDTTTGTTTVNIRMNQAPTV